MVTFKIFSILGRRGDIKKRKRYVFLHIHIENWGKMISPERGRG